MKRDAVVKAMVAKETKDKASALFADWGLSLSDAVNLFLVQSVDKGGLPFEISNGPKLDFDSPKILKTTVSDNGTLIVPAEWRDDDDNEDGWQDA